jgi:PAS domain S-box-containing protein
VVLAPYPEGVATNQALLTEFNALSAAPGDPAADSGSLQMPLKSGGLGMSALLAYSAPPGGQCLCALALIGDASNWDEETRSIMTVVASTVAAQIRHDNDVAELADQQALARTLIASSPDAIVAANSSGRLVTFNPAAEELSGYRRDEVLGKEMSEILIPERERATFLAHTKAYLATGDHSAYGGRVRVPLLHADGMERTVELTTAELIQDGETFFLGFLRDLTELEHSQAALADTEARFRLLAPARQLRAMGSGADRCGDARHDRPAAA